jgi:formylglycine-generating enzyme required for sulfatase activity
MEKILMSNNSANYDGLANWDGTSLGNVTTVGSNGKSSFYGTYDQSGNVWEWIDKTTLDNSPIIRGGHCGTSFDTPTSQNFISSSYRDIANPLVDGATQSFRISTINNDFNYDNYIDINDINNTSDTNGYGSVSYSYKINKYPVTNCEYVEFLNAVAKTDTNGLYNEYMSGPCCGGLIRSGTNGNYSYSIKNNYENKPVGWITWYMAARYCNWLHNNKPSGSQDSSTTENGSYDLSSAPPVVPSKNTGAKYYIPTEDEWYKAAFYKGNGLNSGYWTYATQSNSAPLSVTANSSGDGIINGDPANISDYICPLSSTTTTTSPPEPPGPPTPTTLPPSPTTTSPPAPPSDGTCDFKLVKADVISQIGNSITMEIIVDKYVYDVQIQVQLLDDSDNMLVDYYTVDKLTGSSKIIYFDLPDVNACKIKTRLYQLICFGDGSESTECCTSDCEDCASVCAQNISDPPWDLDDCIEGNASIVYVADDTRAPNPLPEPALPTGKLVFPKTITLSFKQIPLDDEDLCDFGINGSYIFEYSIDDSAPPTNLVWKMITTDTKACNGSLVWDGTMFTISINTRVNNAVIVYKLYPPVRWREFYDDWIINPSTALNSSTLGSNPITVNGSYAEKLGFLESVTDFAGSCDNVETNPECSQSSGSGSVPINIEISLTMTNSCRLPEPCPTSGPCPDETDINDYTQYDDCLCDKCYCDGGGRPIDIDVLCGSSPTKTHPQEPDFPPETESYTLWFNPRGDSALPVINNVLYDTGLAPTNNTIIIKVHTTSTPLEMREWVCKNLRFVTVLDRTKLSTDLNNAVKSNWPYNDLYWNYQCDSYSSKYPNDVPIDLVPC